MEQAAASADGEIAALQCGLADWWRVSGTAAAMLVFDFGGGIVGEGMAEVLDDVETVSASNHA